MPFRSTAAAGAACAVTALLSLSPLTAVAHAATVSAADTYTPGTPALDGVIDGPWTTSQADVAAGQTQYPVSDLLPTYTPISTSTPPDLAVYPSAAGVGTAPYASGQAGTPGPVDGYCTSGGAAPESGTPVAEPTGIDEPMSPYYFPDIVRNSDGTLTGYFDYRPKDTDEAVESATSSDGGRTWTANGEALEQNRGYCPDGDNNDNGQGHSWVATIAGQTNLYTLNRVAGDALGVGLEVHTLTGGESTPLAGLPASQPVGADPDTTVTSSTALSSAATTIPVASTGTAGTATQLLAGQYVDSTLTGTQDVITCTGVGTTALTGCTSATPATLASGDTIEQVVATVSTTVAIPAGPNNASESAGATVVFGVPANAAVATAEEANLAAGRIYVDGNPVYCVGESATATAITVTQCTTPSGAFTANAGDPVTLDPIDPSGTPMTTGLIAPDGIVGTVPSYPGAPAGATVVLYGEKLLNYYAPTSTTAAVTLPAGGATTTVPVASTAFIGSSSYPQLSFSGGSITFSFGYNTSKGFASLSCTGDTATNLTGCSTVAGTAGDSIASGNEVAIPGAALVAPSVLAQTGEGSTKAKTLYKNNEDYTVLRAAYTTDGVNFSSAGLANGGLISGTDPANDINNPAATVSPSATSPYDNAVGAAEPTELRFTGTRGSIIQNADGSETMFLSGAWATDGDSDAFNQIFQTTSTDGEHWSTPTTVVSTDYTFSARAAQEGTTNPLAVSGYYSGRAYSPAAVQNPDGSVTLVFSGYSTPKPLPVDGASIGTGTTPWTVTADDPALYRDILTETLQPGSATPPASTPESPVTVALPLLGLAAIGGGVLITRRRRTAAR
jgi:hypothetical protein